MEKESHAVSQPGAHVLIAGRLKRPINKHWPADNVFSWYKTPITAVEAFLTIIAHAEVVALGYNQIFPLRMRALQQWPPGWDTLESGRRESGELIPVIIMVSILAQLVRLVQRFAIAI